MGMGHDFYETSETARKLMDRADAALGCSLTKVMFEGPDGELTRTCNCQPALYLHGLVIWELLKEQVDIEPVAAAGLSLGEFTAHAAAGTFATEEGLRLVQKRGTFMEEACSATPGAMAAMIGGSDDAVQKLAQECGVDVAKKLNVAGAYHSRLMKSAQLKLIPELEAVSMQMPSIPVYSNYAARPVESVQHIREVLGAQVCGSVRWAACMQDMVNRGERLFLEMGPGKTLAGMMARICKEATVISIEDLPTLQQAVERLHSL